MPATLHKLLLHAPTVAGSCLLPIGSMSEEAAEAANKNVRRYRLRHARKDSRLHTMADLFGYMLTASDPLLSTHGLQRRRKMYARRQGGLLPETLALLADPQMPLTAQDGSEDVRAGSDCSSSSSSDEE